MQRGPLIKILEAMVDTDKELSVVIVGESAPVEIRNVVEVEALHSANGVHITTKQNHIWIDANHVSAAWQARLDV